MGDHDNEGRPMPRRHLPLLASIASHLVDEKTASAMGRVLELFQGAASLGKRLQRVR
ncbi:hypothetical protein SAMD00023353_0101790 [Rosellinia necatrix]|uniref:Uncharacterized protein n=1 Tax=Rosellinia necatrix TaxID=77044 RepID=A0A1S8A4M1_ROSNE|nr:hypothetical protein SAMD00023353_0101790 [Rosellinia necatrix]